MKAENVLGDKAASQEGGLKRGNTVNVGDGVGDIEELGEFGLGVAPRDSRPVHKIEMSKEKEAELLEAQRFEEYPPSTAGSGIEDPGEDIHASGLKRKTPKRKYMDKQQAFIEFKKEQEGLELEDSIRDNRLMLKEVKVQVKENTERCNKAKSQIDVVMADLEKKQEERKQNMQNQMAQLDEDEILEDDEAPQEIIDEEELALLQKLKGLKKEYRAAFTEMK